MIKVGVLGATGFTGEKLVEILLGHPAVELVYIASQTKKAIFYSDIFPNFFGKTSLKCEPFDIDKAVKLCDFLFLALPHTVSMRHTASILKAGKKSVDLSADYRLNAPLYKKFYKTDHLDKKNLRKAIYGLPELFKEKIKKAQLVANPGCYPTSIILALYPLIAENLIEAKLVADSKSAASGAGRTALNNKQFTDRENNFWAYKPFVHQHQPEIVEVIKEKTKVNLDIDFLPQVAGFAAGIYSTIYVYFKKKETTAKVEKIYKKYYRNEPFIRIKDSLPQLKDVVGTNFCDLGFALDKSGKKAVVASSIDNLIKGAAGQAVQNMNLMLGQGESQGLFKN